MRTLVGLGYSPWTERARWALDHHLLAFRYREHLPIAGNAWLRVAARRPIGRVSVPFLADDVGARVLGSSAIAAYAERVGTGARLLPAGSERAIEAAVAACDAILDVARARVVARTKRDPEAQIEATPAYVPRSLAARMKPIARATAAAIAWKYGSPEGTDDDVERVMVPRLDAIAERLRGREHVAGDGFTFADVAVASMLQCVRPVEHPRWSVGPATRRAWTEPALAGRFAPLLAWRDRIYAAHR